MDPNQIMDITRNAIDWFTNLENKDKYKERISIFEKIPREKIDIVNCLVGDQMDHGYSDGTPISDLLNERWLSHRYELLS